MTSRTEGEAPEVAPEKADAYALLSRPTLSITDDELRVIIADLRARRLAFLQGKRDEPHKATTPKAKPTPDSKKAATADLLASLNLDLGGLKK